VAISRTGRLLKPSSLQLVDQTMIRINSMATTTAQPANHSRAHRNRLSTLDQQFPQSADIKKKNKPRFPNL